MNIFPLIALVLYSLLGTGTTFHADLLVGCQSFWGHLTDNVTGRPVSVLLKFCETSEKLDNLLLLHLIFQVLLSLHGVYFT